MLIGHRRSCLGPDTPEAHAPRPDRVRKQPSQQPAGHDPGRERFRGETLWSCLHFREAGFELRQYVARDTARHFRNSNWYSNSTAVRRETELKRFVAEAGWQDAAIRPLAGDASLRRYLRITDPASQSTRIVMDAPAESCGPLEAYVRSTEFLQNAGFSVPRIYATDEERGFMLLEDLGDSLVSRILVNRPELEREIYGIAIDLLVELLEHEPGTDFPEYTPAIQAELATVALHWYQYGVTGHVPSGQVVEDFRGIVGELVSGNVTGHAFVHRDFHAENLIWLPERSGIGKIGVIDHQDGARGQPAYDLVSILEDARRDISGELRTSMIRRYACATGRTEDELRHDLAVCGAQRNLRILGVFARLALRDHKPGYIDLIPRVWCHLMRDLAHPSTSRLARFIERQLPAPDARLLNRIRKLCQ